MKALLLGLVLVAVVEWATRKTWGARITTISEDGVFTGMKLDYPDCAIEWPVRNGGSV